MRKLQQSTGYSSRHGFASSCQQTKMVEVLSLFLILFSGSLWMGKISSSRTTGSDRIYSPYSLQHRCIIDGTHSSVSNIHLVSAVRAAPRVVCTLLFVERCSGSNVLVQILPYVMMSFSFSFIFNLERGTFKCIDFPLRYFNLQNSSAIFDLYVNH